MSEKLGTMTSTSEELKSTRKNQAFEIRIMESEIEDAYSFETFLKNITRDKNTFLKHLTETSQKKLLLDQLHQSLERCGWKTRIRQLLNHKMQHSGLTLKTRDVVEMNQEVRNELLLNSTYCIPSDVKKCLMEDLQAALKLFCTQTPSPVKPNTEDMDSP